MPSYNSAARNFNFPDFDDEVEQPVPARRTSVNVPPPYRMAGSGGPLARQQATLPQPLPGGAPRRQSAMPNVPPSLPRPYQEEMTRRMPARQAVAPGRRPAPSGNPLSRLNIHFSASNARLAMLVGALLVVLVVSYLVVSWAVHTWSVWQDDMTYGRPRITRLEANVGHNEIGGSKTLFIAQNIKGQISITEYPGGDPSKTMVIVGPHLFGKDTDLVPIKLQVKDVNMDGQPDLVANADDQTLIYINDNGKFREITSQEKAKLKALETEATK